MAANDPGTYVDTPGGRMQAAALFYWNGTTWAASSGGGRVISNTPVALVGNGADTTEDVLQTFVIPAGTLRNVGDILRIRAGGTMGATTDTKVARVRISGSLIVQANGTTATGTSWTLNGDVQKTGTNAQTVSSFGIATNIGATIISTTVALVDTGAMTLTVTGQNNTNSVAGSVACRYLVVEYIPGGG